MPVAVSEPIRLSRTAVRLVRGDITQLDVDAFVFYARPDLALGTGFGTAIAQRGGPSVQKELNELGPLQTGQAVVTGAGKLNARHIVHAVGPRFNEPDTEGKLRATVLNALKAAEEKDVRRLALPAMGAGFYAVPLDQCARVMIEAIAAYLNGPTKIEEVVLCVMDQREFAPFASGLALLNR
jgi:O-acetyl-ADP-ribose deacetylase